MSRRVRHHVNPLRLNFLEAGAPAAVPTPAGRLEVELGCGDGSFLFERVAEDPRRSYLGLDIRAAMVERVNRRAQQRGGVPVQALFANINTDLDHLFGSETVHRFHLNFPDPWFKRRHHKRRLLTPTMVPILADKLVPGGELVFQSDVFEVTLDAMGLLEDAAHFFENVAGPWSFHRHSPFRARSKRERQSERRGRRVWRLRYRKHTRCWPLARAG